jgi:hypothetical protein
MKAFHQIPKMIRRRRRPGGWIAVAFRLLDWRVEGRTATGRTDDGGGWELEAADDAAAPGGNVGR